MRRTSALKDWLSGQVSTGGKTNSLCLSSAGFISGDCGASPPAVRGRTWTLAARVGETRTVEPGIVYEPSSIRDSYAVAEPTDTSENEELVGHCPMRDARPGETRVGEGPTRDGLATLLRCLGRLRLRVEL